MFGMRPKFEDDGAATALAQQRLAIGRLAAQTLGRICPAGVIALARDAAPNPPAYCDFLTKCRGDMPISNNSARMIGDAPMICTPFRWDSARTIALERAPAQTKSMRSTAVMYIGLLGRPSRNTMICPGGGSEEPISVPCQ